MKRFFKYLGRIVLAMIGLLLLVVFLLYLPPVQNLIRKQAVKYVTGHTGWVVQVGHFSLGFPLDLLLEDVYAGPTATDTLASVESLKLRVGLGGIWHKEISIEELALRKVRFVLDKDTTGLSLDVRLGVLGLNAPVVSLGKKQVEIDHIQLREGLVTLATGTGKDTDTTAPTPFDWSFLVRQILLQQVDYRMNTASMPYLGAGISTARLTNGEVMLHRQIVRLDSLQVDGAWCDMRMEVGEQEKNDTDTLGSAPWTVEASALHLGNSAFSMKTGGQPAADIVLSGVAVQIDSVYNRGTVVRALLRDLQAAQPGGPSVTAMQAGVDLDSALTELNGVLIRTPYSRVRIDARADTSLQEMMKRVPLSVVLNAQLGLRDIAFFYAGLPAGLLDKKVTVNTTFSLTEKRLQVGQLILSMPGAFRLTGSGRLSSYRSLENLSGNFVLKGDLTDVTFAEAYLKDSVIRIPRGMNLLTRLSVKQGNFETLVRLHAGHGYMEVDGSWHRTAEEYLAQLALKDFPLGSFLPRDSLGNVSAEIQVEGRHYSWQLAKGKMMARIRQLEYRRHDYQDIELQAVADRGRISGDFTSADPDLPVELIFRGDSVGKEYQVDLSGRMGEVDLYKLNFMPAPFRFGMDLNMQAAMSSPDTYSIQLRLDSIKIADEQRHYGLGNLLLNMDSRPRRTSLGVASGDLQLEFRSDTSLTAFAAEMGKVAGILEKQVKERNIDMEEVRKELPLFDLHVEAARENAITRFLNARGIGFRNLVADVVSRKRSGIRFGVQADRPYFGTVRLDSVQVGAWQTGKSLVYSMSAGSSSEAWKGLFNINVTGRMVSDQLRLELKQKDAQGRIGFDLGVNLLMQENSFVLSFFPVNPILGYSRWIVNADNRVVVHKNGQVNANLRMAYLNKLISLQSLPDEGGMHDRLQVEIEGIDLRQLSQIAPFMPSLEGILNTHVLLYSRDKMMGADGNIQVLDMFYQNQRIGTLDLGLRYAGRENLTHHAVDFELKVDSIRRAVITGEFATATDDRRVSVDMDIPSLPLYIVNAFIPADVMQLGGELNGMLRFRGTLDRPDLNGQVAFRQGTANVVMLGTTFRLDTTALPVKDGKIAFRKYRFLAPNNSNMVLNGSIQLTPFDEMRMDLTVNADNFEVVNVKKNNTSLIYGKAYATVNAGIAGPFSNLNVTGNINLLNRTAIIYTLRSSDPSLVDRSADLVRFVSFRDSTLNEKDELTNRVNNSSFSLRMLIEIGDQVSVGVDLSEDGTNHVSIQGGGSLVLVMNPESGLSLSGKYILSGGTVAYSVPIVGKKEFSIQTGSFVEWTGNVMNPMLSISASEQVKANVEDGDQSRQVVFEAIIRIQNTLSRPDITFDLSAPNDMVVQNQLATFSPEERTRQALNLLIYNTYTAPGAAKAGTNTNMANNAIYSFVENELNKYTRKAGLTVGFDSHNTEDNITRTDVTYQFSRQLFNDRVRVKIGGRISTDNSENQSNNLQDNLVDDISVEYVLTKKRNLYLKVFRHSNYESVLDGEVTQTGVGVVWRKNFRKFKDLFKNKNREERRMQKEKSRGNE